MVIRDSRQSPQSPIPSPQPPLAALLRERAPLTVAAFMELALYDPQHGYYARAARRSGRAGDFFTSVDVGPLFGELLEVQIAEMAALLAATPEKAAAERAERAEIIQNLSASSANSAAAFPPHAAHALDLVEAGAGNGRLAADILRAAKDRDPALCDSIRLHLVEASAPARAAQRETLGDMAGRIVSSTPDLPDTFEGVLIANELLDALPTHQVVMRDDGLKEVYVEAGARLVEAAPASPALQSYLDRLGVTLEPGWRVEINLRAIEWIRAAARRLARGFMILIDYGHDARELYSASHSAGTLTTFFDHRSAGTEVSIAAPPWLRDPGERDITAHVDFTSVRAAAEDEGLTPLGFLDQTYFLLGLFEHSAGTRSAKGLAERSAALKTLIMPGGLGSTMKVLILGRGVGTPALAGCSFKVRVT
jgi:SAM-dependent MidA family methyltransferase